MPAAHQTENGKHLVTTLRQVVKDTHQAAVAQAPVLTAVLAAGADVVAQGLLLRQLIHKEVKWKEAIHMQNQLIYSTSRVIWKQFPAIT
jgi:transposase